MYSRICASLVIAVVSFTMAGCNNADSKKGKSDKAADKKDLVAEGKHAGWWCQEHGIPEHLCSLCSDEAAAQCKKDGDWCKLHDRAQSQCFKCDPSKYAKFEAMYEAKYGKKPKRPPEEEFTK